MEACRRRVLLLTILFCIFRLNCTFDSDDIEQALRDEKLIRSRRAVMPRNGLNDELDDELVDRGAGDFDQQGIKRKFQPQGFGNRDELINNKAAESLAAANSRVMKKDNLLNKPMIQQPEMGQNFDKKFIKNFKNNDIQETKLGPIPDVAGGRVDTEKHEKKKVKLSSAPECAADVQKYCSKGIKDNNFSLLDCLQDDERVCF